VTFLGGWREKKTGTKIEDANKILSRKDKELADYCIFRKGWHQFYLKTQTIMSGRNF